MVFDHAAEQLRDLGHEVQVSPADLSELDLTEYDFVYSNKAVQEKFRNAVSTVAGLNLPRAKELQLLEEYDIPTMRWGLAPNRLDLLTKFLDWRTRRILLKRSYTFGGEGVTAFSPWHIAILRWNKDLDIMCSVVNYDDGDIWKAELLNGELLISWVSRHPPIKELQGYQLVSGFDGAYGDRERVELPQSLVERVKSLSNRLTEMGIGHISVDFMRDAEGELRAIEFNTCFPAMWWTSQFEDFPQRHTHALTQLIAANSV